MKKLVCILMAACLILPAAGIGMAEEAESLIADAIPQGYTAGVQNGGTVTKFKYETKDYAGDQAEITKYAMIYLPPGYSEDGQYDLLILCHGIGGNENEWGFMNAFCAGRNAVDHLILNGEVKPLIIVMPNGRSTAKCYNSGFDNAPSFYVFGQELRNDLLPYIDAHYATWGSQYPGDLEAGRGHRAMAGLSMGGMQTINIGLCECLDIISAFGAFSAAPTSYTSSQIAAKLKAFPDYPIRYFYSICGTEDTTAYSAAAGAAKNLLQYTDRLDETNYCWQERKGGHDFNIWNLGLYNFVRILDRTAGD